MKRVISLFAFLLLSSILLMPGLKGQSIDSLSEKERPVKVKKVSIFSGQPGKSMLMSLAIPGAGQWYNGSPLRAHFVWAAVGGMGYVLVYNTRQYKCRRDAYIALIDGVPIDLPAYCKDGDLIESITDPSRLRELRDDANKYRQLSIVGFSLVWLANGVDAFVDAHLKDFDINEDLSIDLGPRMENDPHAPMKVGIFVKF